MAAHNGKLMAVQHAVSRKVIRLCTVSLNGELNRDARSLPNVHSKL